MSTGLPGLATSDLFEQADDIVAQVEAMIASPGDPSEDSKKLRELYSPWRTEAVRHLNEDQRKRFDDEYNGSMGFPKIRKCVEGIDNRPHVRELRERLEQISGSWHDQLEARFINPFREQQDILREAYGDASMTPEKVLMQLEAMCRRLPEVFRVLREKGRHRDPWIMVDEYDVQDVLSILLKAQYDDVRGEEFAPSYAGSGYRVDFWLKRERICIEVKMTRDGLNEKKLRTALFEDIFQYQKFPEVEGLFIFVYDPKQNVANPNAFESDLNEASARFPLRTVVIR